MSRSGQAGVAVAHRRQIGERGFFDTGVRRQGLAYDGFQRLDADRVVRQLACQAVRQAVRRNCCAGARLSRMVSAMIRSCSTAAIASSRTVCQTSMAIRLGTRSPQRPVSCMGRFPRFVRRRWGEGRKKACSFLKKEPKNFCETGLSLSGEAAAKLDKSFLLLFVKKEGPSFLPTVNHALAR